jgi:serine/threonine protein kinase
VAVLTVGQVLDGRYEIAALIASGGMGAVFRARRLLLGDEVAIKVIRPDEVAPGARERFMRESRACARLRHPNIVSIYDFDLDPDGHPFLVMELLGGRSLKDEIGIRGRLDAADVQQILPPICHALHVAHGAGIVHRDLKPANIIASEFGPDGRVYKVVDFGVANMRESTDETRLTAAYQFVGTVTYASPEQLTGSPVDARADVYSLGIVAYEMLTGRVPFEGDDQLAIVTKHLTTPAPRVSALRPDVPRTLDDAIARALMKSPDDRWPSMADFGEALEQRLAPGVGASGASPILGGAYEIGERIGPGRLGSDVFRGVHRALGHPVAVRVLRRSGQANWDGFRARFLREAKALQVAHPSIIQVRDYAEEPDAVYLVTDFIEGTSLREALTAGGAMPWTRLGPLAGQLVEATRVLHRRGGLLCGLTPDMMRLAPATGDEDERLLISSAGIWQAQDLLATLQESTLRGIGLADPELRYVAPEILTGRTGDARSDVFTIGVLVYEMATATLPYDGASMPELMGAMLRGRPTDPRTIQPTLPEAVAGAILRALNPSPDHRFASVKDLAAAFS